jgi:hypothetical protein
MHSAIIERRFIEVRKAAKERLEQCEKRHLCVACMEPIQEGEKTSRGAHMRCYQATMRAIATGQTTEAERVGQGKLLAPGKAGRKPINPVSSEFA